MRKNEKEQIAKEAVIEADKNADTKVVHRTFVRQYVAGHTKRNTDFGAIMEIVNAMPKKKSAKKVTPKKKDGWQRSVDMEQILGTMKKMDTSRVTNEQLVRLIDAVRTIEDFVDTHNICKVCAETPDECSGCDDD